MGRKIVRTCWIHTGKKIQNIDASRNLPAPSWRTQFIVCMTVPNPKTKPDAKVLWEHKKGVHEWPGIFLLCTIYTGQVAVSVCAATKKLLSD